MVTDLGFAGRPIIALPELPPYAPTCARNLYESFGLLLECNCAYGNSLEVTPQPYTLRFAELWSGMKWASTQRGHKWLLANGALVQRGEDDAGNALYLPPGLEGASAHWSPQGPRPGFERIM